MSGGAGTGETIEEKRERAARIAPTVASRAATSS